MTGYMQIWLYAEFYLPLITVTIALVTVVRRWWPLRARTTCVPGTLILVCTFSIVGGSCSNKIEVWQLVMKAAAMLVVILIAEIARGEPRQREVFPVAIVLDEKTRSPGCRDRST